MTNSGDRGSPSLGGRDEDDVEIPWIEDGTAAPEKSLQVVDGDNQDTNGDEDEDDDEDEEENLGADMFGADTEPYSEFVLQLGADHVAGYDDNNDNSDTTTIPPPITIKLKGKRPRMPQFLTSTGLTLWEGSRTLANHLYDHTDTWTLHSTVRRRSLAVNSSSRTEHPSDGVSVVELGAGLGVCGIVAYRVLLAMTDRRTDDIDDIKESPSLSSKPNAARPLVPYVVLTDGDTATLQNMRVNVELNTVVSEVESQSPEPKRVGFLPHITCKQLLWGSDFVQSFRRKYGPPQPASPGVNSTTGGRFDVVLAADVVYGVENLEPLMETVAGLLCKPSSESLIDDVGEKKDSQNRKECGIFLLSYVFRTVPIKMVLQCAEDHGLVCVERPTSSSSQKTDININGVYIFRWAS